MIPLVSAKKSAYGIPAGDGKLGPAASESVPAKGKSLKNGRRPVQSERERIEAAALPVSEPELNEEVSRRFELLIERLTDVLVKENPLDRDTCRVDAITMLLAAGHRLAASSSVNTTVMTMLRQEQAVRERCATEEAVETEEPPADGTEPIFTFMKA
jgi:hypothetical protein